MTSSANTPAMCRNPRRPAGDHQRHSRSRHASTATPWNCSSAMSISQRRSARPRKACRTGWRNPQVELSIVATPNIGAFRADAKRVRQMLFSLLSNAIGFSEPGQTVTLAALRRDSEIVFKVSDQRARHSAGGARQGVRPFRERIRSIRAIAASASACRSSAPLSNCMAARCISNSAPGEGTVVTCLFPFWRQSS